MANDSTRKTLTVATLLCIVCAVLVSSAAVELRPKQEYNKRLETKKNILAAAGLLQEGTDVESVFKQIQPRIVELSSGEFKDLAAFKNYDQKAAAKDPQQNIMIPRDKDIAGIKRRAKHAKIYLVMENAAIETVILPMHGKGLWSTMYAFLALSADTTKVKGFSFYEHGETPGLGGEVDNPRWKNQWVGKKLYDESGKLTIDILKGLVDPKNPKAIHQIDGLSGATLTTVGVENLVLYWLGENGFEPFLSKLRAQGGTRG